MTDDVLDPFDVAVIRTAARDNDIEEPALREALADHQRTMRENPGVEDLVYEWRKQYDDPVLSRTDEMFILAVPSTVWEEYGDYLEMERPLLQAVVAVNQEQTIRSEEVDPEGLADAETVIVVGRE